MYEIRSVRWIFINFYFAEIIDFKLNESHFAYKIIKRMLETDPKVRPNLREIIQSLLTLQKFVELKQKLKHNEKNQEIKEVSLSNQAKYSNAI